MRIIAIDDKEARSRRREARREICQRQARCRHRIKPDDGLPASQPRSGGPGWIDLQHSMPALIHQLEKASQEGVLHPIPTHELA